MARTKRIAIALAPEISQLYVDTAKLMGMPASRLMASLLVDAAPAIKAMQKPLKTALKDKERAFTEMTDTLTGINNQVGDNSKIIQEFIDRK
jgi:hypothetical protein